MKTLMQAEQIKKFKALFEAQIHERKASIAYPSAAMVEEFSVKSEELSDEVDLTSAEQEQGMRLRIRSREVLFLKKIDQALEKIQNGTFGMCECCEEPIELSRLEVRPTANLCLSCKEAEEAAESKTAGGSRRLRIA